MRSNLLAMALMPIAAISASPLNGQSTGPQLKASSKTDLNEIVCEKQKIPGSRLAAAKVCKTRAEWADLKMQDRQDLERVQIQRGTSPQ